MNDKAKCKNCTFEMIEEMAYDIYWQAKDCDILTKYGCENLAKVLVNAGYRKIPEGSVVLTREEYEKDLTDQYDCGYEFGQNETAKEIIKWFIKYSVCIPSVEEINEFANQFGVEWKNER